jgi:hypothetical protein
MGKASNRKKDRQTALATQMVQVMKEVWEPFIPGTLPPIDTERVRKEAEALNVPYEKALATLQSIHANEKIFINNLYQVNVRKQRPMYPEWPDMIHLSIKRRDKKPIHDWRHMQRIKNEILGPEYEAIELYPKESRLVDSANQYHLWVFFDEKFTLNVGFNDGRFVKDVSVGGVVQRPFEA